MTDTPDLGTFTEEHEFDELIFDCPDCKRATDAYILVDRRDCGSGTTWVVCNRCYGPHYDSGMWEIEYVLDRLKVDA